MSFQFSTTAAEHFQMQGQFICPPSAGAVVTFEGNVRDNNHGQSVTLLEYEAYKELAATEGQKIINEAKNKFGIVQANCIHRVGVLKVGDCAVWIAVMASHRDQAFKACRYVIDEIKTRLPIWKKETYTDGASQWVSCHDEQIDSAEIKYYQKQLALPELSLSKQERLKSSKVLVIGAGGLGCPVLVYLASAGVGTIGICDFDIVDESNLHRQVLYDTNNIGFFKTEIARTKLSKLNPFVKILLHSDALTKETPEEIFRNYDLVVDCTDNLTTKLIINERAIKTNTALIQASLYQYEGQIHRWTPEQGQCLSCLWDFSDKAAMCSQTGIIGAVAGTIGSLQAMEAIKFLLDLPSPLAEHIMLFDLLSLETRLIKSIRRVDCNICTANNNDHSSAIVYADRAYEISITTIKDLKKFKLVDAVKAGMPEFENQLNADVSYLVYCHHGIASGSQVQRLRELGWKNVYSLKNGVNGCRLVKDWLKAQLKELFVITEQAREAAGGVLET